jgi:ribosomal-protein-alanine N-acetyltransferase
VNLALVAKEGDLARLAQLHAESSVVAWTEGSLREILQTPGTFAFAGKDGFIVVRAAADEAEILTLAVRPNCRRRGLGTLLVRSAADHAHRLGSSRLFLEVAVSNAPAAALYEGLGFGEVGRRKNYYATAPGNFEDALILRSNLPLSPLGKRPASS